MVAPRRGPIGTNRTLLRTATTAESARATSEPDPPENATRGERRWGTHLSLRAAGRQALSMASLSVALGRMTAAVFTGSGA